MVVLSAANLGILVVAAAPVLFMVVAAGAEMISMTNFAGGDDSLILVTDFASVRRVALPMCFVKQLVCIMAAMVVAAAETLS